MVRILCVFELEDGIIRKRKKKEKIIIQVKKSPPNPTDKFHKLYSEHTLETSHARCHF